MVTQLTIFEGMWSRKMSHSARPRNKSSRRSRSPGFGNDIMFPSTGGGENDYDLVDRFTGETVDTIAQGARWLGQYDDSMRPAPRLHHGDGLCSLPATGCPAILTFCGRGRYV